MKRRPHPALVPRREGLLASTLAMLAVFLLTWLMLFL